MHDPLGFETRVADAFARYADAAPIEVDAGQLFAEVTSAPPAGWLGRLRRPRGVPAPRVSLAIVAVLVTTLTLAGVLLGAGAIRWGHMPLPSAGPTLVASPSSSPTSCRARDAVALDGRTERWQRGPAASGQPPSEDRSIALIGADRHDVSVLDPGTGTVRHLVRVVDPNAFVSAPTWSPDGRALAFGVEVGPPDHLQCGGLFVVDVHGTQLTALTDLPPGEGADPRAWSPDGSRIVGVHWTQTATVYQTEWALGWRDGSAIQSLKPPAGCDPFGGSHWSPDSSMLAIANANPPTFACLVDPNGGPGRLVGVGGLATPGHWEHDSLQWSPDGTALLMFGSSVDTSGTTLGAWLYRVPVVGLGAPTRIAVPKAVAGQAPPLSPDGTRYLLSDGPDGAGTYVYDLTGSRPVRLAAGANGHGQWLADGSVLIADSDGVWVVDPGTAVRHLVVRALPPNAGWAVAP